MDGDFTAMHKVDEGTVKFLELRAPGASTSDAEESNNSSNGEKSSVLSVARTGRASFTV
jgi:hypothetical protein